MNKLLRTDGNIDIYNNQIHHLDSALSKSSLDKPLTLYRATFLKDTERFIEKRDNITILKYPAYMSTAYQKYNILAGEIHSVLRKHFNSITGYHGDSIPVLYTIHCPVGFKSVPIFTICDASEFEVLIGRNCTFQIIEEKRDISHMIPFLLDDIIQDQCNQLFHYEMVAMY